MYVSAYGRRRCRRPTGACLCNAILVFPSCWRGSEPHHYTHEPRRKSFASASRSKLFFEVFLMHCLARPPPSLSCLPVDSDADREGGEAPAKHGKGPKVRRRLPAGAGAQTKRSRGGGTAGRPVVKRCRDARKNEAAGAAAAYFRVVFLLV